MIAFITRPKDNKNAAERLQAYKNQLNEVNIRIDPDLLYTGDFTFEGGVRAVKTFLDERNVQFDALIASNDSMILGAKDELEKRGYVIPEQIALARFDDIIEASSVVPGITTVKQPLELLCAKHS